MGPGRKPPPRRGGPRRGGAPEPRAHLRRHGGVGADDHLLVLALQKATGAEFQHVPFNGTPPIVTGPLSRSIDVGSFNVSEGAGLTRDGTGRALAQGGAERWAGAAAVPTLREGASTWCSARREGWSCCFLAIRAPSAAPGPD